MSKVTKSDIKGDRKQIAEITKKNIESDKKWHKEKIGSE